MLVVRSLCWTPGLAVPPSAGPAHVAEQAHHGDMTPAPESEGIGALLKALLAPPEHDGPPHIHTFKHPEPEPVLDDDGQPVLDEAGEPITRYVARPTHTITHTIEQP
jgi:hypothetical protein